MTLCQSTSGSTDYDLPSAPRASVLPKGVTLVQYTSVEEYDEQ
jgi:hypothetical protein